MTSLVAVVVILLGIFSLAIIALSAGGVIKRNSLAGIRNRQTKRSDGAWLSGHRAALIPTVVGTAVSAALAIAAILSGSTPNVAGVLVALSLLTLLAGLGWSIARATRAAAAAT